MIERFLDKTIYYQRRLRQRLAERARPGCTPAQLTERLRRLGVGQGRLVMVHSSAAAVQRACQVTALELLATVRRLLGPDGTLAMPVFPFSGSMADYLDSVSQPVAVRELPAQTGLLCELFRRSPGVHHSLHPTHPVCAQGPAAEWLTAGHRIDDTPFGSDSPFQRLCEADGLLLGLGVDYRAFTAFHLADVRGLNPAALAPVQHIECFDETAGHWTQPVRPFRRNLPRCFFRHMLSLRRMRAVRQQNHRGVPLVSIEARALPEVINRLAAQGQTPTTCPPLWRFLERCYLPSY